MKRTRSLSNAFTSLITGLALFAATASPLFAADASTLYKSKCVACHAADGTGSAVGKKIGVRDFHSPDVQKESDADLTTAIAKGRNKMPAYEKTLQPDEIKALVAFIHTLQK